MALSTNSYAKLLLPRHEFHIPTYQRRGAGSGLQLCSSSSTFMQCRSLSSGVSTPSCVVVTSRKVMAQSNLDKHDEPTTQHKAEAQEEEFKVLTALRTDYNEIVIVDTSDSVALLLDSSYNVHSILYKHQNWTGSYWDEFASLPAIVPEGPIAILGLGAGTAAHLMLELWPALQLEGWEIDQILIDKAREYFRLSDLEKHTKDGGILNIHVGDALSPTVNISGGYAGIVVDLFSGGNVLPQLQEVATWLELSNLLMPNGRFMVNCGGISEEPHATNGTVDPQNSSKDGTWAQNPTLKALSEAFAGQISWKRMPEANGQNYLAFTGPLPDMNSWSAKVSGPLSASVKQWMPLTT